MKAVIQSGHGDPASVLRVLDVPAEQPAADEVVVRMEAAAMHIADLRTITGEDDAFRFPVPRTPGFEGIGHVVRVGSAVTEYRVGDRVFPALASGTYREEVRCKAAGCLPAPASGDAIQLSLLTVNGPTAEVLLEDFADLAAGDWLVQNAANSSCGRYLIRLARLKGVRTVNVVRRPEMVEELRELGGDVVLVDGPDLARRVAAAVGGAPVKLGIDAVAGPATQRIAECLAPGSTVASYGSMTNTRCEIDFYLMFRRDIRLVGVAFTRQFQLKRTPQQVRAMYARLADLMARGELVAKIAGVYPLEQVVEACARAGRTGSERDGKVILKIS
ncbi:MAG: zinc-dependent alcohol dehydrogenase family protein [Steroidobacteraceae bacterium]|jgi:NADPH:quinone reductase-like Zn-dependent oxidoreductase|nr:zinc-dependent alcohol dehydrogenase family protein [Steroidobacteraceae bacterium]